MEYSSNDNVHTIHNSNSNFLTMQLMISSNIIERKANISEFSNQKNFIQAVDREDIKINCENPFGLKIYTPSLFILKYLLHLLYNKPVELKIIAFTNEIETDQILKTFTNLLSKNPKNKIKYLHTGSTQEIFINEQLVYKIEE